MEKVVEKPVELMSSSERWAFYFQYLTEKEMRSKINEILEQEEGIAMASEALMTISEDELEWYRQYAKEKRELDYHSDRNLWKSQGLEEGLKEGRKEERQRFLTMLDQGLSVEEIKRQLS